MCGWFRREHSCDFKWVGKVGAVSEEVADDVGEQSGKLVLWH